MPDWIACWPRVEQAGTVRPHPSPMEVWGLVCHWPATASGVPGVSGRADEISGMPQSRARQSGGHANPIACNKNHLRDWSRPTRPPDALAQLAQWPRLPKVQRRPQSAGRVWYGVARNGPGIGPRYPTSAAGIVKPEASRHTPARLWTLCLRVAPKIGT